MWGTLLNITRNLVRQVCTHNTTSTDRISCPADLHGAQEPT